MFRFKKSVPVSYDRQGYIYFTSRLYEELPPRAQNDTLTAENCPFMWGDENSPFIWFTEELQNVAISGNVDNSFL